MLYKVPLDHVIQQLCGGTLPIALAVRLHVKTELKDLRSGLASGISLHIVNNRHKIDIRIKLPQLSSRSARRRFTSRGL